jgi:catalase
MKGDERRVTTTDAGIPVASDEHSLTVGPDGPIVLQDHYLIEQMANFNPGTLVRKVMDDAQRDRLVSNVVGHLKAGVSAPVLQRAFQYWRNIDQVIGDRIAKGCATGSQKDER